MHELLQKTPTKDKLCKSLQYTAKLGVYLMQVQRGALRSASPLESRLALFTKHMSRARKVLWVARFLGGVDDVYEALEESDPYERAFSLTEAVVGVVGDIADDALSAEVLAVVPDGVRALSPRRWPGCARLTPAPRPVRAGLGGAHL